MRKRSRQRRLSMTSLIDVIFLLLLFFMLSSTFSRFAEVELATGGGTASVAASNIRPLFLRLSEDSLDLNGDPLALDALSDALKAKAEQEETALLVSLNGTVTSQRLTDLLVILRGMPALQVTVLEKT